MTASKRPLLVFLFTNAIALSLVFALAISCKNTEDTTPTTNTSIQGNWRLTTININPAYTDPRVPIPVTELVAPLNLFEPNCINSTTFSFNNGTVTNNVASVSACANAAVSKQLVNTLFGASTTYTEDGNQLTIRGPQTVVATKTVTNNTVSLVTSLSVNPGNQPTPTSYTLVMTKL